MFNSDISEYFCWNIGWIWNFSSFFLEFWINVQKASLTVCLLLLLHVQSKFHLLNVSGLDYHRFGPPFRFTDAIDCNAIELRICHLKQIQNAYLQWQPIEYDWFVKNTQVFYVVFRRSRGSNLGLQGIRHRNHYQRRNSTGNPSPKTFWESPCSKWRTLKLKTSQAIRWNVGCKSRIQQSVRQRNDKMITYDRTSYFFTHKLCMYNKEAMFETKGFSLTKNL